MRPPRPSLNGSNRRLSMPPSGLSTRPVRTSTTRIPRSSARCAVSSQAPHSCAAKSSVTCGVSSLSSRSPPLPYQPTAEPDTSTAGRCWRRCSQVSNCSVKPIRLDHSSALRLLLQGRSAMGAPAKLITASNGSSASSSSRAMPRTLAPQRRATLLGSRLQTVRRWPCSAQCAQSARPIRPVPPVSRICMASSSHGNGRNFTFSLVHDAHACLY